MAHGLHHGVPQCPLRDVAHLLDDPLVPGYVEELTTQGEWVPPAVRRWHLTRFRRTQGRVSIRATIKEKGHLVIILGVILILLGALLDIGILYTLGGILAVVGVILWLLGAFGRQVGPRAHYY